MGQEAFYVVLGLFYAIGLALVALAPLIVKWHASWWARWYPTEREREVADEMARLNPLNRLIIGRMSDYLSIEPEHPEAVPRMVWFVRLLGVVPLIFATVVLIFLTRR